MRWPVLVLILGVSVAAASDLLVPLHFAIATTPGVQSYGRAFSRTLANVTQTFVAARYGASCNVTLETITVELPEDGRFSARLLESLCKQFEGRHVVAVLIVGDTDAAFTVAMAARYAGIPVLWARGNADFLPGFGSTESGTLEVQLAPTGRELVQALRELLLQAHWHTFTLLADAAAATALQRPEHWDALSTAPLHPTLITLPSPLRPQTIFRKLADISRSTRGVVVLFSDHPTAVRILNDAKRLNMMDGHFVWLWIDTAETSTYRNSTDEYYDDRPQQEQQQEKTRAAESDISDMYVNYLLRNDQFLLLNNYDVGVESSKLKPRSADRLRKLDGAENASVLPLGLLSLKPIAVKVDRHLVKGAARLLISTLREVISRCPECIVDGLRKGTESSCWKPPDPKREVFSDIYARELKTACGNALAGKKTQQEIGVDKVDKSLVSNFDLLNLIPEQQRDSELLSVNNRSESEAANVKWKKVGMVSGRSVRLDTIIWPGGDLSVAAVSTRARTAFRVVTALAPPFVMESARDEDGQCLRGLPCHRVLTADKDNLTLVFTEMKRFEDEEDNEDGGEQRASSTQFDKNKTHCCYGLSMDLLENIAQELEFDFRLYIVADGMFGAKTSLQKKRVKRDVGKAFLSYRVKDGFRLENDTFIESEDEEEEVRWNGIVGDLVSGAAHMAFAPLSVSSARSEVIDFSVPYFFSGVSFLAAPQQKSEIPLMAFLLPFSPELWIAIFTSLNITAIAVAIYEWLSPFGLNPWGRQRSKNFSMSSALWVMWGLLCGHLVAFKAPKSWPNKFLINVWGGFSVIFVASYTANIAALIAGLFFHNTVSNYHDRSLLLQKVGAPRSSAAEYYVQKANRHLWEHMKKYSLENVEEGIERLRNGSLDIIIADTPILDYYRATDHGCKLQKFGDTINEDTYAIGMAKGFPLQDSLSAVLAKYSRNGYLDILQEKWYGGLPCFKLATEIAQPRPLGVAAVTGVFILLGVGMVLGCLILLVEHLFFRYTLPKLRDKPKDSVWRSRNIMFFSQKLYRFINCVELVSPHHAARELVHTIRQGQITSLFQKSIKRKEHEQRRRRKSKAQLFEMIQEIRSTIRRQKQEEREVPLASVREVDSEYQLSPEEKKQKLSPSLLKRTFLRTSPRAEGGPKIKSPTGIFNKQLFSPRAKSKAKSSTALNVRRFSSDGVFNSQTLKSDRSSAVGRRLSKDVSFLTSSPPDINSRRSSYLDIISNSGKLSGKSPVLSIENVSDCSAKSNNELSRKLSDSESIGKKLATLPKYKDSVPRKSLQPQYSLTVGKSDETLSKSDRLDDRRSLTKSYQNISGSNELSLNVEPNFLTCEQKSNLSDDEIARRNKLTIDQLQSHLKSQTNPGKSIDNTKVNPQIRIQIEDTSKPHPPVVRKSKTRHQSLGGEINNKSHPEPTKRTKLTEPSRSLDGTSTESKSRHTRHELPPAPPPPNVSPRNSDGRSPLERLSKDELVLLWRSSESELRSHLLKAIRDKDEMVDPT